MRRSGRIEVRRGGCPTGRYGAPRVVLVLLFLAVACGGDRESRPESNPYVVSIDTTAWIRALETDDLFQTEPAVEGLAALGPAVLPVLEVAMEREPAHVRVGIVEVLDQLDLPETVPLLLRAAADSEPEVRADALRVLGVLGDERGRAAVEAALGDANPSVVTAAAAACETLCASPDALATLVRQALAGSAVATQSVVRILGGNNGERAARMRESLGAIAMPALEREANPETRARAALLVLQVAPERAMEEIRRYARQGSDKALRAQAVFALGVLGGQPEAELLTQLRHASVPRYLDSALCQALQSMTARGIQTDAEATFNCPTPRAHSR